MTEEIKAIKFVLASFSMHENEVDRKQFLRSNFINVPELDVYSALSHDTLQNLLVNLLVEKEKQRTGKKI
jgi:hypothetical protein